MIRTGTSSTTFIESKKGATKQQRSRNTKKSKVAALQPAQIVVFELRIDPQLLQVFSSARKTAARSREFSFNLAFGIDKSATMVVFACQINSPTALQIRLLA